MNAEVFISYASKDLERILDLVDRLDAAGFEALPSQQIVLTGGGSQIPGLDTLAPRILGQPYTTK